MNKHFFALLLLASLSNLSHASKYRWTLGLGVDSKTIGDDEYKFQIGDWNCVIEAVKWDKDAKSEQRRLGCGIGDGLQVYVAPLCGHLYGNHKQNQDHASLNFQQSKTGAKSLLWSCST